jgi:hypothetical protein
MKTNFFFLTLLAFLLFSCEKKHECECTFTTYLPSGMVMSDGSTSYTKTQVTTYENSTRKKAKSLCKSYTSWPQSGEKIEADCELVKNN